MPHDVYVGIGSNVGDRVHFLAEAVRKMKALSATAVIAMSSVYETEPVGVRDQDDFLNAALWLRSGIGARQFYQSAKSIEVDVGRVGRERWGPREIDIDILMVADLILDEPQLKIPHPEMANRKFVLQPLVEIAPEVVHPLLHKTIRRLLAECPGSYGVRRSDQMTRAFFQQCED